MSTAGATVPASLLVGPSDDRDEVGVLLVVLVLPVLVERNGLLLPSEDDELDRDDALALSLANAVVEELGAALLGLL